MIVDDLAVWGPECVTGQPPPIADARAYCRRLALGHYENFPVVSWLLPGPLQQHFCNVYAFCRWADDLGDETGDPQRALQLLSWWRSETEDCYRGITRHPVFVALRETIEQFELPAEPFLDLISAFEQDQHVTEYETFNQLRDYCRRSADPVGRIILRLGGCYDEQTVAWSDSICTGLQLANFWQDVGRDLEIGRIYLPAEDRDRFGYPRDALDRRQTSPEFLDLMRFEVDRARQWLLDGRPLVDAIPGRLRVSIDLFLRGGLQILREIERIDYRVWERRPVVTKRQFVTLFLRSASRATVRQLRPWRASR
ncbi:MAG: squalene synthase HpnC [Maioricimonas sp. JB045]